MEKPVFQPRGTALLVLLAVATMGQSSLFAAESKATLQADANKKVVLGFYDAVSRFDFDSARQFIGDYYIQHSPMIEDGTDGLRKALAGFKEEFSSSSLPTLDEKLVVAEGNLVAMLSHITPKAGTPGIAVGDLFRLQDGKIVEHWDITEWLQKKPAGAGMFDQK
jgi:predicted SnoaL-like aldol condensation-catalyzing enzyme